MAVTEPFDGSTTSQSNFNATWGTLGWAAGKGQNTSTGWGPSAAYPTVNGTVYAQALSGTGSGNAAIATMKISPSGASRYFSLWLDTPNSASARTGYELKFTYLTTNTYSVALSKWQAGAQSVLASQSSYSLPAGSSIALVDNGASVSAWTNTGSGFAQLLSAGDATFEVDRAGLEGSGNITRLSNFKVGLLPPQGPPPDTSISGGPKGIVVPNMSFSFTASEGGSSFECSLDGGAYGACTSPKGYQGLSEASHTFRVRAIGAGGKDETPAERGFQVVQAAKATTKVAILDNLERSEVPLATGKWSKTSWAGEIGGAWMGTYRGYGSSSGLAGAYWSPTSFSDGEGTALVSGVVGTGSTPAGQYSALWLNMPNPSAAGSGYEARFTGVNGSSSNYNVELSKWVSGARTVLASTSAFSLPVGTTMSLTETTGGSLALWTGTGMVSPALSATDSTYTSGYAGLEVNGGAGTVYNFRAGRIDIQAPDTTISSGPSGAVLPKDVSFAFTSTEGGSTFECSLDGAAYGACTSPMAYPTIGSGSHTFRVRAVDAVGNQDGTSAERSFTVTPPPTATTGNASTVKGGATLQATINPQGASTTYQFEYGTTTAYGTKVPASAKAVGSGTAIVEVSETLSGLAAGATYHYRISATNAAGTSQGADRTLTTPAIPIATTKAATNVKGTEATLNASVNPRRAATTYQFEYGATTSYGSKSPDTPKSAGSGAIGVAASEALTGLAQGSTYHYRVVAENEVGTTYGQDMTFTTPFLPDAATEAPEAVEANEATLGGTVDPNGSETDYYFEYGTTTSYGAVAAAEEAGNGTQPIEADEPVAHLKPGTTYHYRLVATSPAGTDLGEDKVVQTGPAVMTPAEEEKLAAEELAYTGALDGGSLPGDFFGAQWTGSFAQTAEATLVNAVKHSGSKMLRLVLAPGNETFPEMIFRQASRRGITILPYVGHGTWPTSEGAQNTWVTYTREVVEKYGPGGWFWPSVPGTHHPPRTWELWNEPNLGSNSPSKDGSHDPFQEINAAGFGDFFSKLSKAAKAGAKNRNQSIDVMAPGLFSFGSSGCADDCHLAPANFLGQMGHQGDYDAVSLHPYVFKVGKDGHTPNGHSDAIDVREKVRSYIVDVRNKLKDLNEGNKKIWVTESGFPVANSAGNTNTFPPVSESTQKEEIESTFGMMKANHANLGIAHAFIYNIQDYRDPSSGQVLPGWDYNSGLRRGTGGNRPAWRGFAGLAPGGDPNWPPKRKGKNLRTNTGARRATSTYNLETQGARFLSRGEWDEGPLPSSSYSKATGWQTVEPPEEGEAPGEALEVETSLTIPNLQPSTVYHYRLATKNENGEVEETNGFQFKTEPAITASVRTLNGEPGWVNVNGHVDSDIPINGAYVNINFKKKENGIYVFNEAESTHAGLVNGDYSLENWQIGKGEWQVNVVFPGNGSTPSSETGLEPFTVKNGYQLVANHSTKCMDVSQSNGQNGAAIVQWSCRSPQAVNALNQVFTFVPQTGVYYQIVARHSNRCVDVTGASLALGTALQQYDCLGPNQTNQIWLGLPVGSNPEQVHYIAKHSGQCIDVMNSGTGDGQPIVQYTCNTAQPNQTWSFKSVEAPQVPVDVNLTFTEELAGMPGYVTYHGRVTAGGYDMTGRIARVIFERGSTTVIEEHTLNKFGEYSINYKGLGAGTWQARTEFGGGGPLDKATSPTHPVVIGHGYRFIFRHSNRCLSTKENHTANGTPLIQWDCAPTANWADGQVFSVVPVAPPGGNVEIRPNTDGHKCVDVAGASDNDGTGLLLWDCAEPSGSDPNQAWNNTPISGQSGWFAFVTRRSFINSVNSGQFLYKCMDVAAASTGNGATIVQWGCHWGSNQQWRWDWVP